MRNPEESVLAGALKKGAYCPTMLVFLKRRHPDLNRGMEVLQTSALPLGYVAAFAIFYFIKILYKNLPLPIPYFPARTISIKETQEKKPTQRKNIDVEY